MVLRNGNVDILPLFFFSFLKNAAETDQEQWVADTVGGVLTGTVHLVALVLACCPAVTLPRHGDALHLSTAAGELPGAAALLCKTAHKK